jgi:hypothetical protein
MLSCEGAGTGPSIYWANISDGRGVSGTLTGVRNVRNVGGGGKNLFARVGIMYVGISGTGVGDVSSGDAGHIHIELLDLYLAGNNAVGILGSTQGVGSTNIVGWIDHILEINAPTGTTGISLTASAAIVKLVAAEIVADTAYNITAGSLYLSCPKITGVVIGTPVQKMIGTAPYDPAGIAEQVVGLTATQTLTNKTINDYSNIVHANAVHERAKAKENILKGQPVFISGYNVGQSTLEIELADNTANLTTGLAYENLNTGQTGLVIISGVLNNVDTSAFSEGDILYVDGTGVLQNTAPSLGMIQPIAQVLRSNATNGALLVIPYNIVQRAAQVPLDKALDGLDADNVQQMYDKFKIMTGVEYGNITPETGVIYYTLPPFS